MDKYQEILREIDHDENDEEMVGVLTKLSAYTAPTPTAAMTSSLLSSLKVTLQETKISEPLPILKPLDHVAIHEATANRGLLSVFRLLKPQVNILSWQFITLTIMLIVLGAWLAPNDRNSVLLLINGAPLLGLLTLFYEHRSEVHGTTELEASCPYTPAQLAGARIIITLSYTILLCLVATGLLSLLGSPLLGNEKMLIWNIILSWLAPMVFFLGIALVVSLRFGMISGCGSAFSIWAAQIIFEQANFGSHFIQAVFWREMPIVFLLLGLLLITLHLRYLRMEASNDPQER